MIKSNTPVSVRELLSQTDKDPKYSLALERAIADTTKSGVARRDDGEWLTEQYHWPAHGLALTVKEHERELHTVRAKLMQRPGGLRWEHD